MDRRVDQRLSDPVTPQVRFDEQPVELPADHRGEARDLAGDLGDDHLSVRDLALRQIDCVGVGEELVAIFGELQRRPALQILERVMLLRPGQPKRQAFSVI